MTNPRLQSHKSGGQSTTSASTVTIPDDSMISKHIYMYTYPASDHTHTTTQCIHRFKRYSISSACPAKPTSKSRPLVFQYSVPKWMVLRTRLRSALLGDLLSAGNSSVSYLPALLSWCRGITVFMPIAADAHVFAAGLQLVSALNHNSCDLTQAWLAACSGTCCGQQTHARPCHGSSHLTSRAAQCWVSGSP